MPNKNVYVVRNGDRWGVRLEGNERLSRAFDTQNDALSYGKPIAQENKSELRIQGQDGKFRQAWSYGNDPRKTPG